jgi:GT2 family glycosyltransferase
LKLSVVIVTCARPEELARCLDALSQHATRHDVDVTTVHAPGDHTSVALVRERFPQVRVVETERRNISHQRNAGAATADGDVLVYLDDDAWPAGGWLDALGDAFAAEPDLAEAGGPVLEPDGRLQMGPTAISRFARTRTVRGPDHVPGGHVFQITGCNMAIRADALRDVGGFDETYAYHLDDSDVALRLADGGHRIGWVPEARVHHDKAPGPHRRTPYDRDWWSVARNDVVFAFRHVRGGRWRLAFAPWALQVGRLLRMTGWMLTGRLGVAAFVRCKCHLLAGTWAGYRAALSGSSSP